MGAEAMRLLTIASLACALAAPGLALAQETLDAKPMAWHGVQLGPEQVFEGDYAIDYQTSVFRPDGAGAADALGSPAGRTAPATAAASPGATTCGSGGPPDRGARQVRGAGGLSQRGVLSHLSLRAS